MEVAAFGYHEVTDEPTTVGFQRPGAMRYKLTRQAFAEHLAEIASGPHSVASIGDIDLNRPGRHVLLTFDDGGKSAVYASEQLSQRGWKGHFFIVTSLIGTRTFLSAAEVRYIRSQGHLIGSHSHTHPNIFREQPFEQMVHEWRVSSDQLSQLLGEPCVMASVPGGDISRVVLESADAAGFRCLFTSEPWIVPKRVGDCWILGRFVPKVSTSTTQIRDLTRFRGWGRAEIVRRAKVLARLMLPGLYRRLVQQRTRPF